MTIAGSTNGYADGYPGQMRGPSGFVVMPDGHTMFVADQGNHRIRRLSLPPDHGVLRADELDGGSNPSMPCLSCSFGRINSLVRAALPVGGDPVEAVKNFV